MAASVEQKDYVWVAKVSNEWYQTDDIGSAQYNGNTDICSINVGSSPYAVAVRSNIIDDQNADKIIMALGAMYKQIVCEYIYNSKKFIKNHPGIKQETLETLNEKIDIFNGEICSFIDSKTKDRQ